MLRAFLVVLLFASCSGAKGGPSMNNSMNAANNDPKPQTSDVISNDILAREPLANSAMVKHILIGWNDGGDQPHDQRAQKRTKKDAEDQVRALMTQIKGGADFDALMKQWSEDPGSAGSARAYAVAPDAQLVIEFKQLGLRLKVGEVGVVQSDYGFHIMKRTE
jgi:parvulin-like peptidyl-prolyl cis-trans isomerase-like protein